MRTTSRAMAMALSLCAAAWTAAPAARAGNTVLVNRVGPSGAQLFIANADGSGEHKLMADTKFDYDASFSEDGKWIVFTSERNGAANIYRVHADGSGIERLTDNVGFDDQATLSPDDKEAAFVSTRGSGVANIWVLDIKTHKARNITNGTAPGGAYRPSWSPDGKWIVFSSDRGIEADRNMKFDHAKGRWEHLQAASLYVIQPDGQGLRRLTPAGKFAGSPKWSPDGKQVVFYELPIEDTFLARGFADMTSQIVSVDIASGTRREHTWGPGQKVSPQYLSGDLIGYLVKALPGEIQGLAFVHGDTDNNILGPKHDIGGEIRNPSWSRDGKKVVYQRFAFTSKQSQPLFGIDPAFDLRYSGEFPAISSAGKVSLSPFGEIAGGTGVPFDKVALSVMDLDGTHGQKIFSEEGGGAFSPTWSPDGQWIAFGFGYFFLDRASKPAKLMMVRADGSEKRDLTSGPLNSGFPSWSPDGKYIVYRTWGDQEHGLRILNVADGTVTKLTEEYDNFPQWSPKGDRIGFTRPGKNAYDVFTIRPDGSDLKQLTDAPGNDAHCAWSPDASLIMFSSSRLGFRDEAPLYDHVPQPYAELFVMNADGSNQHPITDDKWEEGTPAWTNQSIAPQGRTIIDLPLTH